MIGAFGPRATRYARRLDPALHAIVAEPGTLADAYLEAVARRERGAPFYAMVLDEDRRGALAGPVAAAVLQATADHAARLAHLRAYAEGTLSIAGQPAREIWSEVPNEVAALAAEFFALGDGMLVRSFAEAMRWGALLGRLRPLERVLAEPALPDVRPRPSAPAVVVWAPDDVVDHVAAVALGLDDFCGPVWIVCSGGTLPGLRSITFLGPDDPRVTAALEAAAVVVCPDVADPGAAVAFARLGYGIAAAGSAGADEFVPDVAVYDPAAPRSVLDAVGIALARPAGPPCRLAPIRPIPTAPPVPSSGDPLPLVTVVMPSYNRPADLELALACVVAQTYPNLDILVVNDGGVPLEAVVARFPGVRLQNQLQNMGTNAGIITGFAHARGVYLQLLADDDLLYPDHVERLVAAMVRSGASAAHGNTLIRYQRRRADGTFVTTGFNATVFNASTTATEALIATPIAGQAVMFRRDLLDELGGWPDRTFLSDQEFQLLAWQRSPVVWVDGMTSEFRIRENERTNSNSVESGPELRRLFALHPVPYRPLIEQRRELAVRHVMARAKGETMNPTFSFELS